MTLKKLVSFTSALAILSIVVLSARPAEAGSKSACTLNTVAYDPSGRIIFGCTDGAGFYSFSSQAGCFSAGNEVNKVFFSMLQSALLSGRKVDIVYNETTQSCGVLTLNTLTMH